MFHPNADAAGIGVFQAAKESENVYLFGANDDQTHLAPQRVIGSAVIDLPRALLMVAQEVKSGTFEPKVESFGLGSGVIRYVPNPGLETLVHETLRSRVQAAADSIAAGTLIAAPRPASMQASAGARGTPPT
jgi:basic membrane protein A and related proteins